MVSGERGGSDAAKRGAERLPTKNRTRPLGASHPSLFDMSRTLSSAAATDPHVSSWRSIKLHTSPLREVRRRSCDAGVGGSPGGHATSPARPSPSPRRRRVRGETKKERRDAVRCLYPSPRGEGGELGFSRDRGVGRSARKMAPTPTPLAASDLPARGRYEEGDEDVQCAFTPAPVWQGKIHSSQGSKAVDRRRFGGLGSSGPAPKSPQLLRPYSCPDCGRKEGREKRGERGTWPSASNVTVFR